MNKTILKTIIILVMFFIFLYGFSSSYSSNSITNISFVTAIGIDLSEDEENLEVTFEFMDLSQFSGTESSEESSPILDTITANSISSAINILNAYIGKEANLAHCKIIIFSDKVAKNGISSEITELMNNIQVRPTANIIVSRCDAIEYMENTSSSLDKVITKYYDIFPNSSQYTGFTSDVTIGQFYNNLINENNGNIAILGGVNNNSEDDKSSESDSPEVDSSEIIAGDAPIQGDKKVEDIGIAVFKDDKYIGELTAQEALCHSLIINEVDNFTLSVDDIDLNLFHNTQSDVSVDINDDIPTINVEIQLKGKILGTGTDGEILEDVDLNELSSNTSKYLEDVIIDYLNKSSSEFGCDINGFFNYAKQNFLTNQELTDFDWSSKYKYSRFNVDVNCVISYNLFGKD